MCVLQGNASPEEHGVYVWQHFIHEAKAQNIVIVAHSYGGIVTCTIVSVKKSKWCDQIDISDLVDAACSWINSMMWEKLFGERAAVFFICHWWLIIK